MVSLVATAEPNATPPRVRLDLATEVAGQTFTSIAVRRNGVLLREQPYAGGETALGYDYEAPFGVLSTYTADVSYSTWATRHTEDWPSLTGWTTTGTVSVAEGVVFVARGASAVRTIDVTLPMRLVVDDPTRMGGPGGSYFLCGHLAIQRYSPTQMTVFYGGSPAAYVPFDADPTLPMSFAMTADSVTITQGSIARSVAMGPAETLYWSGVRIYNSANVGSGSSYAGSFLIEGGTDLGATITTSTQLDSDAAWLTHIVAPALSMPIADTSIELPLLGFGEGGFGEGGFGGLNQILFTEQGSAWSKTSKAVRSMHYPLGRRRPIVVTSGPRAEYEFSIDVHASTFALRHALDALLADQTPLLLRAPAGYDWDIADGWYSVGDVEVKRKVPSANYEGVTVSLPLTPVDPPVLPQGSTRTYADLFADGGTYAELVDTFDTYTELLAGGAA